jgi:hypothetical protein
LPGLHKVPGLGAALRSAEHLAGQLTPGLGSFYDLVLRKPST